MLLAVLMGIAGIWHLQHVNSLTNQMVDQSFLKERLITQWFNDARLNGTRTIAMAKITDAADRQVLLSRIQTTSQHDENIRKQLGNLANDVLETQLYNDITVKHNDYVEARDALLESIRNGDEANAKAITATSIDQSLGQYLSAIKKFADIQAANIADNTANVSEQFIESRIVLSLLTGLVLIFSVGFSIWISRSITTPLRKAIDVAEAVAEGDLSCDFDTRGNDEISQLMKALKEMNKSLSNTIGELRSSYAHIDSLAYRDSLTGLPNRQLARDRFEQAIALSERSRSSVALLFLDLDNFKSINDSLGHASGDFLLRDVAGRLSKAIRASDTVSRQGGDEFLILLSGVSDEDNIASKALTIINQLAKPFQLDGLELSATCSLGIALYPSDGKDFDTLLKHADIAMYQAKESGRNTYRFYDAQMNRSVDEHIHMVSNIRSALARHEFKLHYQPQFDLRSGDIIGAEALIRWTHPELGMIPPAKFIPVAESSGLIHELGRWVLIEACRQAREWQEAGLTGLVVAINLSPVQFRRGDIENDVLHALTAANLSPSSIELEITESLLVADSEYLTSLLGRFRALGIRMSIDDFGTGYSNLGYLKRFQVNCLKIDQSFIRRMTENADDEGIVRAIIEMAHSLKLEVVAEGIESLVILARLIEFGCELGQGFHWSPALPADEFLQFVREHCTVSSSVPVLHTSNG
jgi:diguanylate cyclase (GGDEF)-like protein